MSTASLARELHDAVLSVPGVVRLASNSPIEVSTQFRGGKVPGLRVHGPTIEVHVEVGQLPLMSVTGAVHAAARKALSAAGDDRPVRVVVSAIDVASLPPSRRGQDHADV